MLATQVEVKDDGYWNRKGRFSLAYSPAMPIKSLVAVMGMCFVLRAEYKAIEGLIEYDAISPLFDVVEYGCRIPTYTAVIYDSQECVQPIVKFVRRDD